MLTESKELILDSLVSKEVDKLNTKLDYWGKEAPINTIWEANDHLSLDKVLEKTEPTPEEIIQNPELLTLYSMAWEFVWGKEPPPMVTIERENLKNKLHYGIPLSDLEKLWSDLIYVDTDTF